jgi:hypothetical protein
MRRAAFRPADCHPDQPHYSAGQCRACYHRELYRGRLAAAGRVPPRRVNQMGRLGLGDMAAMPTVARPTACDKCGSAWLKGDPTEPEVLCMMCGREWLCLPAGGFTDRHVARAQARSPLEIARTWPT